MDIHTLLVFIFPLLIASQSSLPLSTLTISDIPTIPFLPLATPSSSATSSATFPLTNTIAPPNDMDPGEGLVGTAKESDDPSFTDDATFQKEMLDGINAIRKDHDAEDVSWDDTLVENASAWVAKCKWEMETSPAGETLAATFPSVRAVLSAWSSQESAFDFTNPELGATAWSTGAFTQVVWQNTERVGCARGRCLGNGTGGEGGGGIDGWLVGCRWGPVGNVAGGFRQNVRPRNGPGERDGQNWMMLAGEGDGKEGGFQGFIGRSGAGEGRELAWMWAAFVWMVVIREWI